MNLRPNEHWPDIPERIREKAVADTGAQICTAGPNILKNIEQSKRWLLPTKNRLRGVGNNKLSIIGTLLVDISSSKGHTTELLYICEGVSNTYLSQTALKRLDILRESFPEDPSVNATTAKPDSQVAPCGCKIRSSCPPLPDKLPFPPTEDHRLDIENWIKNYYESSAFNVCKHQKLQVMTGEPLQISFLPDHPPKAVHTPIPIPHHWKYTVKSQLDSDVALGIIEPVPPGHPTTWCSRMVVVPKKDGTPRRTVDLQELNKATQRETHHTLLCLIVGGGHFAIFGKKSPP